MSKIKRLSWVFFILILINPGTFAQNQQQTLEDTTKIKAALEILGLEFDDKEISQMARGVISNKSSYENIRKYGLENSVSPSIVFNPIPPGFAIPETNTHNSWESARHVNLPGNKTDIAFMSIRELSYLIKNKHLSSVDLTKIYLERLKTYDDTLFCVVNLTEELALKTAARMDKELADGNYRGPLHGVPYGIKDLMAVKGYPTTWGAMPFKNQFIDENAAVVEKLEQAGAVLIAKLTSGALAMGDVWFGGITRNPWNPKNGSSGSSAGPASATSAGLVAFAIGTETLGSIVSPSTRCGVTGLRPTYGTVSKYGTMALSWSMDKIGPICRNAEDCAMVMDFIRGGDPRDASSLEAGFYYPDIKDFSGLRIGYLKEFFDKEYSNHERDSVALNIFKNKGAKLIPVSLPQDIPVNSLRVILSAEAAAAFDQLTLSNEDSLLVNQGNWAWPNSFRTSRLIPAVEYIQANRIRTLLIREMDELMKDFDVIIAPLRSGNQLTLTNLTGHPSILLPNGFDDKSNPTSFLLIGPLFSEALLCKIGDMYQNEALHHGKRPPLTNTDKL